MPKTNYANAQIQSALYGGSSLGAPATWYVGWSTTQPNQDGSNVTEPSGNGYARVAVTNNATNFPAAVDNTLLPSGATTWAASTAVTTSSNVFPTTKNGYYYACTTAGTTGSTQPTWPTTPGATVTDGTAVWTCHAVQGKMSQNANAMSFPQSTGTQGTPGYLCIFDASTGGHLWEYETINGASAVNANTTFSIPANNYSSYNN